MTTRTIRISEATYLRLQEHATNLHETPEEVIERMLASELLPTVVFDDDTPIPAPGSAEALAAVDRLVTLFAAVPSIDVDAVLADPMITLACCRHWLHPRPNDTIDAARLRPRAHHDDNQ